MIKPKKLTKLRTPSGQSEISAIRTAHPLTAHAPLFEIDGSTALENRKSNPFGSWGKRDEPNRVEPIATPGFDVPFQFVPGESIFTIGSCFARNVETKLMECGFDLPVRRLFKLPEFASVNPGIINNFGTPSIFNEFSWALDPEHPYVVANNIVEVASGKFVDLHVIPSERPGSFDDVVNRRRAITEVTKSVAECRVVIMTLGLVELWYDREHDLYLNATVMPALVKKFPGRFALRVLDFTLAKGYLDRAFDVLKKFGRNDQQILLTVSPVPLASTFRMQDVMVANAYSKAVLRATAEQICAERVNVHYYPSYESITHSERKEAWLDDFTHVTDKIVQINVGRLVAAFVPREEGKPAWMQAVEAGGVGAAVALAAEFLTKPQSEALPFFDHLASYFPVSAEFAFFAASTYLRWGKIDTAEAALAHIPAEWAPLRRGVLEARILARKGDHKGVIRVIEPIVKDGKRIDSAWSLLVTARAHEESYERARETLMDWLKLSPKVGYQGLVAIAAAMEGRSNEQAIGSYERAFALEEPRPAHAMRYAELLVREKKIDEMRKFVGSIKFDEFAWERRRLIMLQGM